MLAQVSALTVCRQLTLGLNEDVASSIGVFGQSSYNSQHYTIALRLADALCNAARVASSVARRVLWQRYLARDIPLCDKH